MTIKGSDVLIAGILIALGFIQLVAAPPEPAQLGALLTLAMTMPLLARRSWPVAVVAVVTLSATAYALTIAPTPPFAGFLALILMSFTLTLECELRRAFFGLAIVAACVAVTTAAQPSVPFDWLYPLVYLGGAAAIGRIVRLRSFRQSDENAHRLQSAVAAERGHIARELHDVVAHGLGVMVLHAEVADELMDSDPNAAHESLGRVQDTGREAIGELKLLLGLLRSADDSAEHSPQPLLAQLPALISQVDGARFEMSGDVSRLPTGLQLAVYRVVQEALTNVVKHSLSKDVSVRVDYDEKRVLAEVVDSGPRRLGSAGPGHGLVGMRERARLYGGTVDAAQDRSGFRVRLVVPTP